MLIININLSLLLSLYLIVVNKVYVLPLKRIVFVFVFNKRNETHTVKSAYKESAYKELPGY